MDKSTLKYVLIPVDENGNLLKKNLAGADGAFVVPEGYAEILITEEQSQLLENLCDVIFTHSGRKVFILNRMRFLKQAVLSPQSN